MKLKAREMNVGINFMALDDERQRQEHIMRELKDIEDEVASPALRNTKLPHLASTVGVTSRLMLDSLLFQASPY